MLNRDQIIDTVAEKHKFIIDKDDPILATLAVHQVILDEINKKFSESLSGLQENLETVTANYTEVSKELGNNIIGEALNRFSEELESSNDLQKKIFEDKMAGISSAIDQVLAMKKILIYVSISLGICGLSIPLILWMAI